MIQGEISEAELGAWVLLLRGVNVGGKNRLPMDSLKRALAAAGATRATTLLQSGNAVLASRAMDPVKLGRRIESAIETEAGIRPPAVLLTVAELRGIVEHNPFDDFEPAKLAVHFLSAQPEEGAWDRLRSIDAEPEEVIPGNRAVYIYYPNGMGQTRMTTATLDRALKVIVTARSWNTTVKLLQLAEGF